MEGKIYCIKCLTTNQNYIGSTFLPLIVQRLAYHIQDYNKWKNNHSKSYLSSFEILERKNYEIQLLESLIVNNKDELRQRERYYYDTIENINKNKPYISKEELLSNKAIRHLCVCGKHYTIGHRTRHYRSKRHKNYISGLCIDEFTSVE